MPVTFDGAKVKRIIKHRHGSIDRLIADSNGLLAPNNRSALYRAVESKPVEENLAYALAEVLCLSVSDILLNQEPFLRLTREQDALCSAIELLRRNGVERYNDAVRPDASDRCLCDWLRERLDIDETTFNRVRGELSRIGRIERTWSGEWACATPSLAKVTSQLKRRIAFQWPVIRDAFAKRGSERRRMGNQIVDLIELARTQIKDPLAFFCTDDLIHECFCTQPGEVAMIRASRTTSWAIAHDLITDLTIQSRTEPTAALLSMKMIAEPMLRDYEIWSNDLRSRGLRSLSAIKTQFTHHVLRMRDHAQYYSERNQSPGSGNETPGSARTCWSTSDCLVSGES